MAARHEAFAVCAPGIEEILREEMRGLGLSKLKVRRGGVEFIATTRQLYAANVWLRTATRIVVRASRFHARHFDHLEARSKGVEWERWLTPGSAVRMRVGSRASRLYHTEAIEERVRRAIGAPAADLGDEDAQLVVVRLDHDDVTISIDSSGAPLYKRGWRLAVGKAPLRETLAAAMLLAGGYDGSTPLVDPFAGSGTVPIEAGLIAAGRAPGASREFAFQRWPTFEPGTWASVRAEVGAGGEPVASSPIAGSDRDAGVVDDARANAERAGVAELVPFERRAVSDAVPVGDGAGLLVTNPPYGGRASPGADLRNLYARFGAVARERFAGWSVGVLSADPRLDGQIGLDLDERWRASNGGIRVRFLTGTVPS